jgi:hypothetical protein
VHVFGFEISAIKTAIPLQKRFSVPLPSMGGKVSHAARINTGLPCSMTLMAVASKWFRPGTVTEW